MRLAQRLLLGAVFIVSVLMIVAVSLSDRRLRTSLQQLTVSQLAREARLVAQQWQGPEADDFADASGNVLGHRVTLVDSTGTVLGDSEFDGAALTALQNHNNRPEILAARDSGIGSSLRLSPSEGVEELYVAVGAGNGRIARVSLGTTELDAIVSRARNDVLISGIVALIIALALAVIFSAQVSKPVTELRDVTTAIAGGDMSRRPALSAPGEVGELAHAVRRMAEQLETRMRALEAEDELQGALVEALNDGVVAIDRQKRVVRINRSGRQLLGAQADTPFSLDLLPRDRSLHDAIAEALEGRIVDGVETRIGARTLALSSRPLGVGGAVLTVFDLTGIRRLETVRRDFVANVSHELKTPLTAIRGFAETLQAELVGNLAHVKFAETIRSNAVRMQSLIDDLLDLSRIESGGWTPTPEAIDVLAIAGEVAASYRDEATGRGSSIVIDVDRATKLRADRVAVRQIVGNLVENAVRYTPSGGTVTIFARPDEAGTVVGVRDTGNGIPSEHLPRIFERFYRVDPARSRSAGGTGLGLAIVRHLVEAHGGAVRAESAVGRGTTVWATFPA